MGDEAERPQRPTSDLLAERRAKLERLRDAGVEPFPHTFGDREDIAAVRPRHEGLAPGEDFGQRCRVAGRITARRGHGKAAFIDLRDRSGQIQLHSRADVLSDDSHERLAGLDLGDFVGVEGEVFATKSGELTVRVAGWELLAKSLRPLPDTYYGLEDTETRYRRRELDLLANAEVRELFELRARTIAAIRSWLDQEGFLEVETPVLQPLYGGALARPFTTHHNALDRDLYLRIATELYLKRCVVGGIERVYELGKDFRNEGISHKHNPEFTMLEFYEAYADYEDAAERLEQLVADIAERVLGTTKIERDGTEIDLAPPWRRITLREAIADRTGLDLAKRPSREELAAAMGSEPDQAVGGVEIANAFTELNDPDEQRRRFEQQAAELRRGDEETQPFDEAFLEALEHGMPPTAGVGLGIDRLVMVLTGARNLREVVLFPTMRS